MPLAVVGYGESDLAHKVAATVHTAHMNTGSPEGLENYRWSVRGVCADQGTEKALVDIPNIEGAAEVQDVLERLQRGDLELLGSQPSAFFYPKAIFVSGPLHILWNAFATHVKLTPEWSSFKETLSAILYFLGHQGLRERFLETCFLDGDIADKQLFSGWKHKIIDWKWEYMEEVFTKLSPAILVFFRRFDERKIKTPVGHSATDSSIDPKCLAKLTQDKLQSDHLAAICESYDVFGTCVGRESRWFTSCGCHAHIWMLHKSDVAKQRLFQAEEGKDVHECIWRGRRGSELARGHWRGMLDRLKRANSFLLQARLTKLKPEDRAAIAGSHEKMIAGWIEEIAAKFRYWEELPHCLLGIWPNDDQSQNFAQQALQKWEAIQQAKQTAHCHRVTYRLLHPDSLCGFSSLVKKLADTGEFDPWLEIEIQDSQI